MAILNGASNYASDKTFLLKAYSYDTGVNTSAAFIDNPSKISNSALDIVLPAPTNGFTLNESGNWEEMEGLQSIGGDLIRNIASMARGIAGAASKHYKKGTFVNDYASLSYSGSEFRTWSFDWELMYNSAVEANTIYTIINSVRRLALPVYEGPEIQYPYMWKLFPIKKNAMGLYLKDCVITSVDVNYSPDGVMQLHTSNHPTKVALTIAFKELYRADRRDILDESGLTFGAI